MKLSNIVGEKADELGCTTCGEEHRQLLGWLLELKKIRGEKMRKYRCIKIVEAEPAKLSEEEAKAKEIPERAGEDGYKVVYKDGYESWSPKKAFEEGYISLEDN